MQNRKKKTLHNLIKKWIREGSIIVSDEWPAYLRLSRDLPQYEHCLICHKKATGGGFSKIITLKDGSEFNVNTNKCEGLWAQLKQKTKRIHGTSTNLTDSYMMEAMFRQNVRARGENLFDAFVELLRNKYNVV